MLKDQTKEFARPTFAERLPADVGTHHLVGQLPVWAFLGHDS